MVATESNRRSASLKIHALPFRGVAQKYPYTNLYKFTSRGWWALSLTVRIVSHVTFLIPTPYIYIVNKKKFALSYFIL